ncbi:hypothetical protein NE237_025991 [Protea cynaroides]|uniref:Uncharacterized protein n=1 Tax=Protea cynaroides TaxID=273540 RepID=A0A9Q0K1V0_9MAGN|nr:hypothetical protein NE237_025991 [Protea cynaroides]
MVRQGSHSWVCSASGKPSQLWYTLNPHLKNTDRCRSESTRIATAWCFSGLQVFSKVSPSQTLDEVLIGVSFDLDEALIAASFDFSETLDEALASKPHRVSVQFSLELFGTGNGKISLKNEDFEEENVWFVVMDITDSSVSSKVKLEIPMTPSPLFLLL